MVILRGDHSDELWAPCRITHCGLVVSVALWPRIGCAIGREGPRRSGHDTLGVFKHGGKGMGAICRRPSIAVYIERPAINGLFVRAALACTSSACYACASITFLALLDVEWSIVRKWIEWKSIGTSEHRRAVEVVLSCEPPRLLSDYLGVYWIFNDMRGVGEVVFACDSELEATEPRRPLMRARG